jgi:hypothetical protein
VLVAVARLWGMGAASRARKHLRSNVVDSHFGQRCVEVPRDGNTRCVYGGSCSNSGLKSSSDSE